MLKTLLIAAVLAFIAAVIISYICFRIVFYVPQKNKGKTMAIKGAAYDPYRETMKKMVQDSRKIPYEDFYIKSFDGLTLHAKYYECRKGADTEIMFHGYRGSAERDLSGGIQRCFAIGRNALVVDQRTSCGSGGNVITFGINEHRDCIAWAEFAAQHFGSGVNLILCGISMGASTVLMAAGKPLPPNVKGVLADCGFSTAEAIIKKCSRDMHLPTQLVYPFIKLGARLYGKFDLEEYSALESVKNCRLPVIFFHGESDDFVPCDMSRQLAEACASPNRLVTIAGAGHGIAYLVDPERYLKELSQFFTENGLETKVIN
ncbi:MAG: prolyl oligopeptidase family serine peptidase [Oscillospiraceae bacterium]|nr:prolyl oligopeptidase family serine peptidase [Oscillospiraceae bacterium]